LQRDYRRIADVHFEAGYVPKSLDVDTFAQALRAVGEPIFGRCARDVSMGRLLGQLFEVTAQFDMALRPELVLLQKTMATVEGVARRIDPGHDIWAAADPVVRRWISRELSPAARLSSLAKDGISAVKALAKLGQDWPPTPQKPTTTRFLIGAMALGAAFLGLGFILAKILA
jgi:ubiquinone biosynthesis protein